jgi:hypothetical protein
MKGALFNFCLVFCKANSLIFITQRHKGTKIINRDLLAKYLINHLYSFSELKKLFFFNLRVFVPLCEHILKNVFYATLVCFFLSVGNLAADQKIITTDKDMPLDTLREILDSPDFGGEEDSWGIRFKNKSELPEINFNPLVDKLRHIFAVALRLVLIVIIAGLFVFLFLYLYKFKGNRSGRIGKAGSPIVKTLLDKSSMSPEYLLKKAVVFFEQGNVRMAWGYCTAAAILSYTLYQGVIFPPNATENDCASLVNLKAADNIDADKARGFNELMNNWVNLAYAGRFPPAGSFNEALALCESLRKANG